MKKILLACAAGMSTSLLVSKMEQAAKLKGIEVRLMPCRWKLFQKW